MNPLPTVSIIIPAYNAEKYIVEAIHSVREQDWTGEIQIIVVDDGSSDHGADLARSLDCLVLSKTNGGAASARNLGIENATGDFCLFLDADDLLTPKALKMLYEPFIPDPSLNIVFGQTKDFISPELSEEQASVLIPQEKPYRGSLSGCVLIKRDAIPIVGKFDETLKSGETVDWLMRIRSSSLHAYYVDEVTSNRRIHMFNTGRTSRLSEYSNYAALIRKRMKKN